MFKLIRHALLLTIIFGSCVSSAQAQGFFDPVIDDGGGLATMSQADTGAFGFNTDTTGPQITQGGSGKTDKNSEVGTMTQYGLMAPGSGFTGPACNLFGSGGFPSGGGKSSGAKYGGLPKTATSLVDITVAEK